MLQLFYPFPFQTSDSTQVDTLLLGYNLWDGNARSREDFCACIRKRSGRDGKILLCRSAGRRMWVYGPLGYLTRSITALGGCPPPIYIWLVAFCACVVVCSIWLFSLYLHWCSLHCDRNKNVISQQERRKENTRREQQHALNHWERQNRRIHIIAQCCK
jgi:hypothetical protein